MLLQLYILVNSVISVPYFFDFSRLLDNTMFGGMVRYFNLSCDPNCITKMLDVNCDLHNIIFANQQIFQGLIMCKLQSTFTVSVTQLGSQE